METTDTEESAALRAVWREFHDRYLREAEQWSERSTDPNARIDFMMLRRDMQIADRDFGECLDGVLDALGEQTARGDRAEEKWKALGRAVDTLENFIENFRAWRWEVERHREFGQLAIGDEDDLVTRARENMCAAFDALERG